jgi:hypothetical protein
MKFPIRLRSIALPMQDDKICTRKRLVHDEKSIACKFRGVGLLACNLLFQQRDK